MALKLAAPGSSTASRAAGGRVGDEAIVEDAILFDDVVVGNNARVKHCIVDKGVVIPDGETVGVDRDKDAQRFHLSPNGIVVIPKHYRFQP